MRCVLLALTAALSGCVINGVRPYDGGEASAGRAVVVYGLTVAGAWGYPRFGVTLGPTTSASRPSRATARRC